MNKIIVHLAFLSLMMVACQDERVKTKKQRMEEDRQNVEHQTDQYQQEAGQRND